MTGTEVLRLDGLRAIVRGGRTIVDGVSLSVRSGEIVAVVGESGSGKSTTALALLGYARPGVTLTGGSLVVGDQPVSLADEQAARAIRGRLISYVPQDPTVAINPVRRVAGLLREMRAVHGRRTTNELVAKELERVGLPGDSEFRQRFPHQLSGGQRQRLAIAVALACDPPVLVLDEPTTALDVLAQAHLRTEVDRLRREEGVGVVYITHDLASVATLADTVVVMYAGRVVERGPADRILSRPRHPYTAALLACAPDVRTRRKLLPIPGATSAGMEASGCSFAARCALAEGQCRQVAPPEQAVAEGHHVRCWETARVSPVPAVPHERSPVPDSPPVLEVRSLCVEHRRGRTVVAAVDDVSFTVGRAECVAVVGASGSGKTTVARAVVGLHPARRGDIQLHGTVLPRDVRRRSREQLRAVQLVFQNPFESLNPRQSVADQVARAATVLCGQGPRQATAEALRMLELVRLPAATARRFPGELSGGERQRVALARALAGQPEVLVCDEITSALDVSVQAAVLETLDELATRLGLAVLFITHDLGVVASVADRVVVLESGRVRETGTTEQVLREPRDPYTRSLVSAAPHIEAYDPSGKTDA